MLKVPKIESSWNSCNILRKSLATAFVFYCDAKHSDTLGGFRSYETLKSGASHIWFDESSRLIEWFLHVDSDSIIFGLTINLLCIFDICWVSITVVLVKNDVFFLSVIGKVLELGFSKCFLIKAWLSVKKLYPV